MMADEVTDDLQGSQTKEQEKLVEDIVVKTDDQEALDKVIAERVSLGIEEALKPIKEKLNGAYEERDTARKLVEQKEKAEEERKLQLLKEQGKHQEAHEIEMKRLREQNETLVSQNTELTRNTLLRNELNKLNFRGAQANDMAFRHISSQLQRSETTGDWIHSSGVSISDFVKAYGESSDNSFLFEQIASSGSGQTTNVTPANISGKPKSIFDMTQAEVLAAAEKGQLPSQT